jgi:hypothetical protein
VHLLVEGLADISDSRRFIKAAKQYSGYYFERQFRQKLWQRYGYERTLRDDEATLAVAKQVLDPGNPRSDR